MKGFFLLLASFLLVASCTKKETIDLPPQKIIPASIQNPVAYVGEYLDEPLAVQVLTEGSIPVPDKAIQFSVDKGQAKLTHVESITDANGIALTNVLPNEKGHVEITASLQDLGESVGFVIQVSESRFSKIRIVQGNDQEGIADTMLPEKLTVEVSDDFGTPFEGAAVKFVVTQGNGLVDELDSITAITDESGQTSVSFQLGSEEIFNKVTASIANGTSVEFKSTSFIPVVIDSIKSSVDQFQLYWSETPNVNFSHYLVYESSHDEYEKYNSSIVQIDDVQSNTLAAADGLGIGKWYHYKVDVVTTFGVTIPGIWKTASFGDYIQLDGRVGDFEVDEDKQMLYYSDRTNNDICIYDLHARKELDRIHVGSNPIGIDLDLPNSKLYVALNGSGEAAIVDLTTRGVKVIDIQTALGDPMASDIVKGNDSLLFVIGNPGRTGSTYLTKINMNTDQVSRFGSGGARDDPKLVIDYGKYIYLSSGTSVVKIDMVTEETLLHTSIQSGSQMVINGDKTELLLMGGEVINTETFEVRGTTEYGIPLMSKDNSKFYSISQICRISTYNASTFERENISPFTDARARSAKLIYNDSLFLISIWMDYGSPDYPSQRFYFVANK